MMHFFSLLPVKLRRRFGGCAVFRRLMPFTAVLALLLFIFHQRGQLTVVDGRPQMNDRRILESDNVVIIPSVKDSSGGKWKSEEDRNLKHPKHLHISDRQEPKEEGSTRNIAVGKERNGTDLAKDPIVVLVICATRPGAIENHLNQLIKLHPSVGFPIVVSQDGTSEAVTSVIRSFIDKDNRISFIHHKDRQGAGSEAQKKGKNYFYIAQHYKWALDKIFFEMNYTTAIITEDDLDIAEDFFSYFSATRKLLYSDSTIWCISAWNDNGGSKITDRSQSEQLYRTDFFPGLGWMLTVELWKELSPIWPEVYWDDWLRRQDIRRDRVCIRPEVSRTAHNNKVAGKGSSGGLYKTYLASVRLPESPVNFSLLDFSYLIKDNYDRRLLKRLSESKVIPLSHIEEQLLLSPENSYVVYYNTPREYRRLAKAVGLMVDIRSGMPRTAYHGIVTFMVNRSRVYALPHYLSLKMIRLSPSSKHYDEKWDSMTRYLDFQEAYCKPGKYTGKCDPKDPDLIAWFKTKRLSKRLASWGEMIVN